MSQEAQEAPSARPIMGATAYTHPDRFKAAPGLHGATDTPEDPEVNAGTPKEVTPEPVGHDWEERYRKMQSYQMKQENQLKREIARLESNTAPAFKVPKTLEQLEAFETENPDLYKVIQSVAHGIANKQMESVNGEVDNMRSELKDASRENAIQQLRRTHPDFEKVNESTEFTTWLGSQPADIQAWVVNNHSDASLISRALSLFKYETGWGKDASTTVKPKDNSQERLKDTPDMVIDVVGGDPDAGSDPRKHPKYVWSEHEIQKMRGDEYAHYSKDIELALSEGRIAPR